jgi:hypothetical protein
LSHNRWACLYCIYVLFFPFRIWSIGDIFDQHFLMFMGPSWFHCFIGLRRCLRIRVYNTIQGPTALPYFTLLGCRCLFLNPCQANLLCVQGDNILWLNHILGLWNYFLAPLALLSNPHVLAWCVELW